jgi:hypothetical protein
MSLCTLDSMIVQYSAPDVATRECHILCLALYATDVKCWLYCVSDARLRKKWSAGWGVYSADYKHPSACIYVHSGTEHTHFNVHKILHWSVRSLPVLQISETFRPPGWYEYRGSEGGDGALGEPIVAMLEKYVGAKNPAYCRSCRWAQHVFQELLQNSVASNCVITQNTATLTDS